MRHLNGALYVKDGIIRHVGNCGALCADEIYDAGGGGFDFMDATAEQMREISQ